MILLSFCSTLQLKVTVSLALSLNELEMPSALTSGLVSRRHCHTWHLKELQRKTGPMLKSVSQHSIKLKHSFLGPFDSNYYDFLHIHVLTVT